MDVKLFLKQEFVQTLKMLDEWENKQRGGDSVEYSHENFFEIRYHHYHDGDEGSQRIYIFPDGENMYLLSKLSSNLVFRNSKMVPKVIDDLVAGNFGEDVFEVWRLSGDVKDIKSEMLRKPVTSPKDFGFWAVKKIPLKDLTEEEFATNLTMFANRTDQAETCFWNTANF